MLFLPLDPGFESGIRDGKKFRPGSGKNIPDLIFENLVSVLRLKILTFLDADPVPGSGILATQVRD